MTKQEQEQFVINALKEMGEKLLEKSDSWYPRWGGPELRKLIAYAADSEVDHFIRDKRMTSAKRFEQEWMSGNLYS